MKRSRQADPGKGGPTPRPCPGPRGTLIRPCISFRFIENSNDYDYTSLQSSLPSSPLSANRDLTAIVLSFIKGEGNITKTSEFLNHPGGGPYPRLSDLSADQVESLYQAFDHLLSGDNQQQIDGTEESIQQKSTIIAFLHEFKEFQS